MFRFLTAQRRTLIGVILLSVLVSKSESQHNPNFEGSRTTLVHLFEWRWNDIARECVEFLGPKGYGGVQVSPVSENVVADRPSYDPSVRRPWYERYQPVSYNLDYTRSGNQSEFQNMVTTCNRAGVRIYVDAVINHMTGYWPPGTKGTGGADFNYDQRTFPAVPYAANEFNGRAECPTADGSISDYLDPEQSRNCMLIALSDLNQRQETVRTKIVEFLNRLVGYGVAGFRIDAAKHMWPEDLEVIYKRLNNLPTSQGFPANSRPFIYQEVIVLGVDTIHTADYSHMGRVTEFYLGKNLGEVFQKVGGQQLRWLQNFGEAWDMMPSDDAVVFIDNHDNQRGSGILPNDLILTFRKDRLYKMAIAFMQAWNYGVTRVMSSYFWEQNIVGESDINNWIGPPHDNDYNTLSVTINPDGTCGNGWLCEHRWREIYGMAKFRNVVAGTTVTNWWDNAGNQIAFSRGNKGFIAINNDNVDLKRSFQTGLPAGQYCDVISGDIVEGKCTGILITVSSSGTADIEISSNAFDGVIAIHTESKL